MSSKHILFDFNWDVDNYKPKYDPEHWDLCKKFMLTHKTKYPEQKLIHLTEAFYQIGVYGSSYDAKTTRMVSALAVEVLEDFLTLHPGSIKHPFKKSLEGGDFVANSSKVENKNSVKPGQSTSIWDVSVDKSLIVNVLRSEELQDLLKGFVIIYDIRQASTMNDNKVSILEESFKRSKFGVLHWVKDDTHNNVCPIRLSLKWKSSVLAEAEGSDEKALKVRIAQAVLSKIASFSSGIEAKWSYYRDGRAPEIFERPNTRRTNIYRVLNRCQFKAVAEITTFIDTFANSDSFAEIIFGMDFGGVEKKQIMEHIVKTWGTKLTYRTVNKVAVKGKTETHICVYHIRTGEELRRWLEQCDSENERYRLIPPGEHRRAGACDGNVREVLTLKPEEASPPTQPPPLLPPLPASTEEELKEVDKKQETEGERKINIESSKNSTSEKTNSNDLEKLLSGFVLFYDANKNSEIDKDDWFTALNESFKVSKFGSMEVVSENVRPLRTRCTFVWNKMTLASAEGLTETQAKTAATLQLIAKLEPFTYIIQAKEEYFCSGKVPPFIENPEKDKLEFCRVLCRQDHPSYYSIFQTIDDFTKTKTNGEIVFGADFTWELKNEILVYIKAKGLDYRYFTPNKESPPTHMAVYHLIKPEELKKHLLEKGGENYKYKLIPPQKAEMISDLASEVDKPKGKVDTEQQEKALEKASVKQAEKPIAALATKPSVSVKPAENPSVSLSTKAPTTVKPSAQPAAKPGLQTGAGKVAEKRKEPETDVTALETDANKIQINLKKFKKTEVEYPEDTGGDFPGLILWIGVRKNSRWERSLFCILMESFKLSKYGELFVEESEETVWGRKEPLKKCVMKYNRKVMAVGLGESKTEAKNSASLQVLRQLRKHCYTIQAKESYFKEGKATPYDFNPDPKKEHVYRLAKKEQLKDKASVIKFVDEFAGKVLTEEVIFGDDFTYEERESILDHCRKINLNYRLIKCQSASKVMHTHIALYHQQPLPAIKAALMKEGGETDMFRLIPPGAKVTNQHNDNDLWPDTLENGGEAEASNEKSKSNAKQPTDKNLANGQINTLPTGQKQATRERDDKSGTKPTNDRNLDGPKQNSLASNSKNNNKKEIVLHEVDMETSSGQKLDVNNSKKRKDNFFHHPQDLPLDGVSVGHQLTPISFQHTFDQGISFHGPLVQGPMIPGSSLQPMLHGTVFQEAPFGPQPFSFPGQPFQDVPLVFGPQPPLQPLMFQNTNMPVHPADIPYQMGQGPPVQEPVGDFKQGKFNPGPNKSGNVDLREELAKKRQGENLQKENLDRKVYDMSTERKVTEDDDSWSRKVFVAEPDNVKMRSKERNEDLREKLRQKDSAKEKMFQKQHLEKQEVRDRDRLLSPGRNQRRMTPEEDRKRPLINRRYARSPQERSRQRISPQRNVQRMSQERDFRRVPSERESFRGDSRDNAWEEGRRVVRRDLSRERFPRNSSRDRSTYRKSFSRSPIRSPIQYEVGRFRSPSPRFRRSLSPATRRRDLWDNIARHYSESIFMYKYVKQDSRTEDDPFALLRATRSLTFNVDFDFITQQISIDEYQVSVELMTDDTSIHPLVGEGLASTQSRARLIAAHHAVDTVQKACRVIEPNYSYFADGGVPDFILRKYPLKTRVYEIIQNLDPTQPVDRYTVDIMLGVFVNSELEDIFFLADDFSYMERCLIIDLANQHNLMWRLFGPRHPDAPPDDIISTQHICVFKQKPAVQLITELLDNGGSTEKYTLVDPRESRITRPRDWHGHQRRY